MRAIYPVFGVAKKRFAILLGARFDPAMIPSPPCAPPRVVAGRRGRRLLVALVALLGVTALARPRPVAVAAPARRPALVVLIVIDQLRSDYIERFGATWSGGLRRLLQRGVYFPATAYPYLNTVTCTGHATIATGTLPAAHGMILNGWWEPAEGRVVPCTEDAQVRLVAESGPVDGAPGDSPRRLLVPTLGDVMREQLWPPPRVVSLSLKARSAITLAGRAGDAVLWFHGTTPVTSTAYAAALPAFARGFDALAGAATSWTPARPAASYWFEDAVPDEAPPGQPEAARFPHPIGAQTWPETPAGDRALVRLTLRALSDLALGRRATTDLLAISFSTLDLAGHRYGPRSHEVQDVLARLDQELDVLLRALDRQVGQGRYLLALTSDHGVAPLPEQLVALGVDAGRIAAADVQAAGERAIAAELGGAGHVAAVVYTDLYLAEGRYARLLERPGALERVARALEAVPGIEEVFPRHALGEGSCAGVCRLAAASYFPGRSGDLVLVPRRHWIPGARGTTHGSANDYDRRVPLLFFGAGVRPGRSSLEASPADLAPTLAARLGVTLPRADGRALDLGAPAR